MTLSCHGVFTLELLKLMKIRIILDVIGYLDTFQCLNLSGAVLIRLHSFSDIARNI